MIGDRKLTIGMLLSVFRWRIGLTWALIIGETVLTVLIPLFMGFAIDGLLNGSTDALFQLAGILMALVLLAVARRMYDTRAYGAIRVAFGKAQVQRSAGLEVSALNARLDMGRELVDFLEDLLPQAMASALQFVVSIVILYTFSPILALAGAVALIAMMVIYSFFHGRFYRLNGALNHQTEKQVEVLELRRTHPALLHLLRLRRFEVKLSDAEAVLYGLVFVVLLGLILFNLWYTTVEMQVTAGTIFSVVSYSWEFAEAALALPITLQSWSRLSEITQRLNRS